MTAREHLRAARHHLTEAVRGYPNNSELDAFTQSCLAAEHNALRAETVLQSQESQETGKGGACTTERRAPP